MRRILLLLVLVACHKPPPVDEGASLTFVRDGKTVATLDRSALLRAVKPEDVETFDPYYEKTKHFRALPLGALVAHVFGAEGLDKDEFILRARDGYAVPMRGSLVTEDGGYVAVEDLDVPGWQPIGPQHVSPGPFYVVWTKPGQANLDTHPRPWELDKIEIARFDTVYPHTSPGMPDGAPATRGYALFRDHCIKCHTINREGGHVGPDLNLPKNITEYRPEDQIRQYIKDPAFFRYGNMPAQPELSDANLDDILAYLKAMKDRKAP